MRRYEVLEKLIKQHGWTKGAEIGLHRGTTFFYLLHNCPDLHLIGVDSWLPLPADQIKDIDKGLSSAEARTPERMAAYSERVISTAKKNPRATVHHMASLAAASLVPYESLDFVFVDADHSEQSVLQDVRAWAPKVRKGGWVLGHDEQWPSVRRALSKLFDGWTVHQDNVWSVP